MGLWQRENDGSCNAMPGFCHNSSAFFLTPAYLDSNFYAYILFLQEYSIHKGSREKLGMSIRGGALNYADNTIDRTDDGIFISKVCNCFRII